MMKDFQHYFKYLNHDLPAGIVVFLVALPLCLGIALASGAPLFSGIISGVIGGIIVAWVSGSQLSVSGPAAGLTVVVFNAIDTLGSFQGFLLAVVMAGGLQIIFGYVRAGILGAYFPSSVIKGMLAAIGLILILKQIPHAVGYDVSFDGDESYMQETAASTLEELFASLRRISLAATVVSSVALILLIAWENPVIKRIALLRLIPGPVIAVIWGVCYNIIARHFAPTWAISDKHLVSLPVIATPTQILDFLQFPDLSFLHNPKVYTIAITLAIIASLETLLSLEAIDKIDPLKRISPANRELKAQGLGNILSGLLGGLPMTAVIVRSVANVNAGAQSKVSAFSHGVLLLLSALFFAHYINMIPLACLAAILLQTGYKLAKPKLFIEFYQKGLNQLIPFVATIVAILISDLLKGVVIGIVIGLYYVIRANYHAAITLSQTGRDYVLMLNKDVSFLNRALLRRLLDKIDANSHLLIDGSKAQFIDYDILETLHDFMKRAQDCHIKIDTIGLEGKEKLPISVIGI